MRSFPSINQFSTNKLKHGCPQKKFSLGVKTTFPFPTSPFPFFLPLPFSPLHILPFRSSGHLNPVFGEGCIANYCENQLVLPSLPPCPFLSPLFSNVPPPSLTLTFPSLLFFPFLCSFLPLSSLPPFLSSNLS